MRKETTVKEGPQAEDSFNVIASDEVVDVLEEVVDVKGTEAVVG